MGCYVKLRQTTTCLSFSYNLCSSFWLHARARHPSLTTSPISISSGKFLILLLSSLVLYFHLTSALLSCLPVSLFPSFPASHPSSLPLSIPVSPLLSPFPLPPTLLSPDFLSLPMYLCPILKLSSILPSTCCFALCTSAADDC